MGISLTQDPAIPPLCIYANNTCSYKNDTCSTMLIAALFVIARTWKQPICTSTEEWIEKMWYIYTMEYYLAEKKQWKLEIHRQIDGTRRNHPEWGNPVTKWQTWYVLTHMNSRYLVTFSYSIITNPLPLSCIGLQKSFSGSRATKYECEATQEIILIGTRIHFLWLHIPMCYSVKTGLLCKIFDRCYFVGE